MNTVKKTFELRDLSRFLIAFGIIVLVLNFSHNILIYLLGSFTLILGVLNLFTLDPKIKFIGALNMALVGVYFALSGLIFYYKIIGLAGALILAAMGVLLLLFSLRFIIYYIQHKQEIRNETTFL